MSIQQQRPIHVDLTTSSGNPVGPITFIGFLTRINPTICGRVGRDKRYYCIKSADHDGRHRYGIVYEGRWSAVPA